MKLRIRIRGLKDGRFRVSYYWSIWEPTYHEYFDNAEEVAVFLAEIVKNTKW